MTFKNNPTSITIPHLQISSTLLTGVLIFAIPFFFGHSQLATGTIVNSMLLFSVIKLSSKSTLLIAVLPSLAVLARGMIFGPLTVFLIYFLPFIWLGNLFFMNIFKKSYLKIGFVPGLLISSIIKALFLYIVANIFFNFHIIPIAFLTSMGIIQLLTALLGGGLTWIVVNLKHGRV